MVLCAPCESPEQSPHRQPDAGAQAPSAPAPAAAAGRRVLPVHHEVVRNKDARAKMDAITCPECRAFFDAAGGMLSAEAMKRVHDECSRHRVHSNVQQHQQQPSTPEGYWKIGFTQSQGSDF